MPIDPELRRSLQAILQGDRDDAAHQHLDDTLRRMAMGRSQTSWALDLAQDFHLWLLDPENRPEVERIAAADDQDCARFLNRTFRRFASNHPQDGDLAQDLRRTLYRRVSEAMPATIPNPIPDEWQEWPNTIRSGDSFDQAKVNQAVRAALHQRQDHNPRVKGLWSLVTDLCRRYQVVGTVALPDDDAAQAPASANDASLRMQANSLFVKVSERLQAEERSPNSFVYRKIANRLCRQWTQKEIAEELGLGKSRVSELIQKVKAIVGAVIRAEVHDEYGKAPRLLPYLDPLLDNSFDDMRLRAQKILPLDQ